jgi:molecular chaperone GrpE
VSEEARAIAQARSQLLDVLSKEGLERVDAVGVAFDPTVHDAVAHSGVSEEDAPKGGGSAAAADSDGSGTSGAENGAAKNGEPHTVLVDEVLRAGYRWRGQVLRPAMVRVRG